MDCVFCNIIAGELPSTKIYEDKHTLAFLTIAPETPGHVLVIPKKHVVNIRDCHNETLIHLFDAIKYVSKDMKSFKIVQNNEKPLQEVFHLHFHVIPCNHG